MEAALLRRIRCSPLWPHRKASSPGSIEERVESVMYRFVPSTATTDGGDGFQNLLLVWAPVWGMQAGRSGLLRRFGRPEMADLRPEAHGVEPRPMLHIDMCSAVCGSALFGSQSSDVMVLRRLFSAWCLSPLATLLVDGSKQRFGSATNPLRELFVYFFCVGRFLLMCQDSSCIWNCLVWSTCVVTSNSIL
jgi:hypothetical protein